MEDRIQKLMQALPSDIDGVLITSPVNRQYFTGFSSSAGVVLATRGQAWFIIDSRYAEAAQRVVNACQVVWQKNVYEQLNAFIQKAGIRTLAVESGFMSLKSFAAYRERLEAVELLGDNLLTEAIARQRCIKSREEIQCIRRAQRIADQTFSYILGRIEAGRTEREIALELEFHSRKLGSEGPAFQFIVVSGKNSSLPHGVPSDKKLEPGDLVTMDFGAIVGGYCSDMTRTVAVGSISEEQRHVYETVLAAQRAALQSIRAGAVCSEVDKVARDLIDTSYQDAFGHGLGHSLGLEIHEEPRFSTACQTVLEPGMILSVEPGIYLPGKYGVRIEDIVAVTETGCENLTASNKELVIV